MRQLAGNRKREGMEIEPSSHSPENSTNPAPSGANSGALAPEKPAPTPLVGLSRWRRPSADGFSASRLKELIMPNLGCKNLEERGVRPGLCEGFAPLSFEPVTVFTYKFT